MKLAVFLAFFAVLAYTSAMSNPDAVYDGPTYELTAVDDSEDGIDMNSEELAPFRQRRVTCDLLSWQSSWLSVNHAACAARCIAQRRKGGVCRDGVCVCRR